MSRSDATRVHPPLPVVVHAELAAGLSLDYPQLTPAALSNHRIRCLGHEFSSVGCSTTS